MSLVIGLTADTAPEAVGVQIGVIDQMRDKASRINTLRRDRISEIKRDILNFENVVAELVEVVAGDLVGERADSAVLDIEKWLAEAERVQGLRAASSQSSVGPR